MMKSCSICVVATGVFLGLLGWRVAAEPLRAVELDPQAPESVVQAFRETGVNTLAIPFRRRGDLADASFQASLARWGKLSAQYKLRYLVVIRLFGPPDYTGSKKKYRRARDPISGCRPCVCPTDPSYWADVVVPRVRQMAVLAKKNGLTGALFEFQATLAGNEYNLQFCYCDACWAEFVKARCNGDEKVLKLSRLERVNWLHTAGIGLNYFDFLSGLVEKQMKAAVRAARGVFPKMELGIYGYWDAWFYHGVARALSEGGCRPWAVMAEYERYSLGRLRWLAETQWRKAGLDLRPIACVPLDYYLPRDVQNQLAELDRDNYGFLLTSTDSLWRRVVDDFHVYPPHGSVKAFADALRNGLAGHRTDTSTLFNRPHCVQFIPRIGLLHGKGVSDVLSGALVQLAEAFQLPCVRLDAAIPDLWVGSLSAFEIVAVMPGAGAVNPKGLATVGPAFDRFLRNGGMMIVLNAADAAQLDWLASHDRRFGLKGEMRPGLKQAWLDDKTGLMASPVFISKVEPLMWHFTSFAKEYQPLAKDDTGCSYLLRQDVGRGTMLVSAGPIVSPELIANSWFYFMKRGECFNVELTPGSDEVHFGENRLILGAAEFPESAGNVDLTVDVIDSRGGTTTERSANVSLAGDGVRIPLRYLASDEGAGRLVVTLSDPVDGALIRRFFINLVHDHRVEVLPDKNYYTTEQAAVLMLRYHDESLRDTSIQAKLGNDVLSPALTGEGTPLISIPIASLKPGVHRLHVCFLREGKPAYSTQLTIRKEESFPTAVKVLYHRNCVLEVEGKPFFPLGCYGISSEQEDELVQLGVNTTIHTRPGKERKLMVASHELRRWAADKDWTSQKVREELRKPEYSRLLSWYMYDEPAFNNQSPDHVMETYLSGRAKDPYHPQMSVYIGSMTYPRYPDYVASDECQMMDDYPLPYFAPGRFGDLLAELARAARGRRTIWAVPQCFDWRDLGGKIGPCKPEALHPSEHEALHFVYHSIARGAGAITFWTYRYAAADPRRHEGLKKALAEGARLAGLVTHGTVIPSPQVKPLSARIRCRSFRLGKEIYIVAVNPTNRTVTVEFGSPYLKGKRLRQWLPVPRQLEGLSDTFDSLDGRAYVVEWP